MDDGRFQDWQPPQIEHGKLTKWNWMVHHPQNLQLGNKVDIGSFSYINAQHGIVLEDDVQIGSHCSIYSVSTIDNKQGKVTLKKNARVGSHTTIMPGITIGENSIVGAHSFVNKDLPDNVVAVGVPAKVIKEQSGIIKEESGQRPIKWKIPLFKTYSDQNDIQAVSKVISRGTEWANGPEVIEFENKIAEFVGTKHALTFNSGTSALHALLVAHNIKDGEVIVPSFTFIATSNSVVLAGANPIFAEVEPQTFGLDAQDVRRKITPKTKAIIVVHYAGFPARDTLELRKIADELGIFLIEDAAESMGASINGQQVGSFGHSAILSFCQNKIISTGEGGAIVTNDPTIHEKAKLIRSHGRVEFGEDYFSSTNDNDYIEAGYNFRMPSICAALGLSQLNKIREIIGLRRGKARYFKENLIIGGITFPEELDNHFQVYQLFTVKLSSQIIRDQLQSHLSGHGIMSKVYFNPMHLKTIYRKYDYYPGTLPSTEGLSNQILTIPFYPTMSQEEIDYLLGTIRDFFRK